MPTASLRRKTLFLLLIILLGTSWASAVDATSGRFRTGQAIAGTDVDLLVRLWSFFGGAWSKAGCNIDPDGRAGCHIDPNGCCFPKTPPPPAKAGCNIDPNGVPRCTP